MEERPSPSRPMENLLDELTLRGCATVEFAGAQRPVLGRIVLLGRLGRGGMGVVYHGTNPRLATDVAVKILTHAVQDQQPGMVERFLREARLAAQLHSDHLVRVLDVDFDPATHSHFLVMEYVHGSPAGAWARQFAAAGRPVPEALALDVCIGASAGLAVAHRRGIIHRDIKPDNILLPTGADGIVACADAKLADLGLARMSTGGEESLTGTQLAIGTPGYMAPEQAQDAKRVKKPADVFAMGATLYSLLCGRSPFVGATPIDSMMRTVQGRYPPLREVRRDVSAAVATVIDICLRPDAAQRYPDAPALLEALRICRRATEEAAATVEVTLVPQVAELANREEQGVRVATDASGQGTIDPLDAMTRAALPETSAVVSRMTPQVSSSATIPPVVLTETLAGPSPTTPQVAVATPPGTAAPATGAPAVVSAPPRSGRSAILTVVLVLLVCAVVAAAFWAAWPNPAPEKIEAPPTPPRTPSTSPSPGPAALEVHRSPDPVVAPDKSPAAVEPARRRRGRIVLSGGPPGAEVTMDPAAGGSSVHAKLDASGGGEMEVDAGTWRVRAVGAGFEDFEQTIEAREDEARSVAVAMEPKDGTLSIESDPPGAEVFLDGSSIGAAPIKNRVARPGNHEIRLRLPDHEETTRSVTVDRGRGGDPVRITLHPWCRLDTTKLGEGVTVSIGGRTVTGIVPMAPPSVKVLLRRENHADQELTIATPLDAGTVAVRAADWADFATRLDLSALPEEVTVVLGGKVLPHATIEVVAGTELKLELRRPGFAALTVPVTCQLGQRRVLEDPATWQREVSGALADLAKWDAATDAERTAIAQDVERRAPEFKLARIDKFAAGGQKHQVAVFLHQPSGLEFALVPGGTFTMGSPPTEDGRKDDESRHEVSTTPFLIARTEVTEAAWQKVTGSLPLKSHEGPTYPAAGLRLDAALDFCERAGLEMPTEAEWEYACRAGTTSPWCCGSVPGYVESFGWFDLGLFSRSPKVQPVGMKSPNAFGLFDVHGNLWEWCRTRGGPPASAAGRDRLRAFAFRGGSRKEGVNSVRSAARREAQDGDSEVGLRPIRRL